MVSNKRNSYGVKDSYDCYLTIRGVRYESWSDHKTKEECQAESPNEHFIVRTIGRKCDGEFRRVYRRVTDSDNQ